MSIFTLSYHSRNLIEDLTMDSLGALEDLLQVSRARNASLGVTGALLFNEGRFLQVLEGDETQVRALYNSILRDRRHSDVTLMTAEPGARRRFARWSMAFVGMTPAARAYYKRFAVETEAERTKVSIDALCELLTKLLMIDAEAVGGGGTA
jgi:hypothetical protein